MTYEFVFIGLRVWVPAACVLTDEDAASTGSGERARKKSNTFNKVIVESL